MNFSMFNIIIFVCFYCVVPLMYVMLKNETKQKKNIVLGTTLPFGADNDPEVKKICAEFVKQLNIMVAVFTVLACGMFMFSLNSYVITYMSVWFIVVMVILYVPYVKANGKLRQLKLEKGWYSNTSDEIIVDIRTAGQDYGKIGDIWFIIPTAISFVPVVWELVRTASGNGEPAMVFMYGTFAVLVLSFYLLYKVIFRLRSDNISDNSGLIIALTEARRHYWGEAWIWLAWLTALLSVCIFVFYEKAAIWLGATAVYTVAIVWVCMKAEFDLRAAQQKLTEKYGIDNATDDDRHWIWGIFYHNPNDNHLFVNNRVGMNMTLNLAKTSGKIVGLLTVLLILALPFLGIFLAMEEKTEVSVYLTEDAIVAEHTSTVYTISFDEITHIESIDELNTNYKIWGTGMDTVYKGKFRVDGYDTCMLCLDPRADSFVVISTEDGKTYIFSADTDTVDALEEKVR